MTPVIVSIVVLVAMFVIATVLPINLGALGFVAAAGVGVLVVGMSLDDVLAGFPADLFLILLGLTYLFAVAHQNGTVDLLVRWSMRLVRGHLVAAPWIFFTLSAVFSAIGALFAVAIVAPLAMPFARRYGVDLLLMGMMVVHGSLAGAFSPISVYGTFVAGVVVPTGIPFSPTVLFLAPLVINLVIAAVIFVVLGGRSLAGRAGGAQRPGGRAGGHVGRGRRGGRRGGRRAAGGPAGRPRAGAHADRHPGARGGHGGVRSRRRRAVADDRGGARDPLPGRAPRGRGGHRLVHDPAGLRRAHLRRGAPGGGHRGLRRRRPSSRSASR